MGRVSYISKHIQYINTRLSLISSYLSATTKPGMISSNSQYEIIYAIIQQLCSKNILHLNIAEPAINAISELQKLVERWDIIQHGDIVGYIYQHLKSTSQKKRQGQYFTPPDIVSFMVDRVIDSNTDVFSCRILDPACGSGQFLIAAFSRLMQLYRLRGVLSEEAAERILSTNLFGTDVDPVSVLITHFNLMKISGYNIYKKYNIHDYNYVFSSNNRSSIPDSFSHIIGNPPWGASLTREEKQQARALYTAPRSGINIFTLFIEKSLSLLTEGGAMAFLVPEAYLNIRAHRSSREHMLNKTKIREIALWGERFKGVFAPSVTIIAERASSRTERIRNIVRVHTGTAKREGIATLIPQAHYQSTHENIFNVHYTRRAVNVLSQINDQECIYLKDRARFFLGVVTGNNPKHLCTEPSDDFPEPIIIGKDVEQYAINFSGHYFKYSKSVLQQVAPRELYERKDKLLYKFIGRNLVFALDREGHFSLNNVNGIIPTGIPFSPWCLTALLNSRVMQYYYEKNFFTVKVLRGNLEKLPIIKISPSSQQRIHHLSEMISNSSGGVGTDIYRENIEDMIYYEYGFRDREAFIIQEAQRSVTSNSEKSLFAEG